MVACKGWLHFPPHPYWHADGYKCDAQPGQQGYYQPPFVIVGAAPIGSGADGSESRAGGCPQFADAVLAPWWMESVLGSGSWFDGGGGVRF